MRWLVGLVAVRSLPVGYAHPQDEDYIGSAGRCKEEQLADFSWQLAVGSWQGAGEEQFAGEDVSKGTGILLSQTKSEFTIDLFLVL